MNNNKNKHPLASFAKSVLTEVIRLMPVQMDIWRLEKEIRTLKSQNLELTSRLAAVENGMAPETKTEPENLPPCVPEVRNHGPRDGKCEGGHAYASEPGMKTDKPKLAFRIHDAEHRHIGQVNLNGRVFIIDMEELSTAIRRAADLLKRQFKDPSRLRLISDTTGRGYDVVYDEARWPCAPSVTLVTGAGSCEEKRYTFHEIQNTAAWIIEHDIRPNTKWTDEALARDVTI